MEGIEQALAVSFVLLLLGGALWWLRRKGLASFVMTGTPGKTRTMKVVERLPLTPQHSLHLVRVGSRTVLIAASPNGCSILESLADSESLGDSGR